MGAPVLNGPFTMPMVSRRIPQKLQPWLYLCIAAGFQLGGGVYLGALNEIIGEHSLMREDVQMCMYCTLCGMSLYFPLLFRMKFRFTNKTLLRAAAVVMIVCNLAAPFITFLPLLWAVCFLCGMAKIQGTFECMSNIQLWMTPQRDFTVFFPWLQMLILCAMQVSDLLTSYLMYYYHWTYMHWFIIGYMLCILVFVTFFVHHFRFMRPLPLFGIDWAGMALWGALMLEVTGIFCYGDWMDWWNSPDFRLLVVVALCNLVFCLWRMLTIRHPYFEPRMWMYRHLAPVLILITFVEGLLASEHVLEEIFYGEVMHYEKLTTVQYDWVAIAGIVGGCLFSYWWMHKQRQSYIRLCSIGLMALSGYFVTFYFNFSPHISQWQLLMPVLLRSFAYASLCCAFFVWLNEIMTFQHFFQSLSVFNALHAVVGGVMGAAFYQTALRYLVPDNMSRYGAALDHVTYSAAPFPIAPFMETFVGGMMQVSLRQIYGTLAYASIFLTLLFLLYDTPVRTTLKLMPSWWRVAKDVAHSSRRRHRKKPATA